MKRLIHYILLLSILLAIPGTAAASKAVDDFIKSGSVNPATTGVLVVDLSNGKVIESYNADKALIPASITKAVTIASLISKTGIDHRYHTRVYIQGNVSDGILEGNLLIKGSGDPTINTSRGPKTPDFVAEIVSALKKQDIKRITGDIVIDQTVFPGPNHPSTWEAGNKAKYYGTGTFGLNFEDNRKGEASVANPAAVFTTQLKAALKKEGIALGGEKITKGKSKLLLDHKSATIDEIMRSCMMRSDNMFAETMIRSYAQVNGKEATTANGTALEMDFWRKKGANMDGVRIVDGSGLSRSNAITPRFMADILAKMAGNVNYVSFFPLAGQEGTLGSFLRGTPLEAYIAMKTGSMTGIQCYAGYKLDEYYAPTHAVVIMINNFKGDRKVLRKHAEKMLLNIFS